MFMLYGNTQTCLISNIANIGKTDILMIIFRLN